MRGRDATPGTDTAATESSTSAATWHRQTGMCLEVDLPREPCSLPEATDSVASGECLRNADCDWHEFCWAGGCEPDTELIEVCLEEMSYFGSIASRSHPEFEVEFAGFWLYNPYRVFVIEPPIVEDTCAPVWHACATWQARSLVNASVDVKMVHPDGARTTVAWAILEPTAKDLIGRCTRIELHDGRDETSAAVVVSATKWLD